MITSTQVATMEAQNPHTLAEWWNELNTWKWVDALGPAEAIPERWTPETQRSYLMRWIESKVGMEYILRVCNVDIDKRMTDDEFTKWWKKS